MERNLTIIFSIAVLIFSANFTSAQKRKNAPQKKAVTVSKPNRGQQDVSGEVEGNVYKNKFFGLKITIPEQWLFQESQVSDSIKQSGSEKVKGKTAQTQKSFGEAVQRLTILYTASKDILGMENNAVMVFAAEEMTPLMQVRNGEDVLRLNLQTFKKMQLPPDFKYSETIRPEKMGNETFHYIDVQRTGFSQRFYAIARKGYSLFFTLNYVSDEDLETMKNIIRNSDFSWKE
jgi:hypothetical protein